MQLLGLQQAFSLYYRLAEETLNQLPHSISMDFANALAYKSLGELSTGWLSKAEETSVMCMNIIQELNTKVWLSVFNLPNHALIYRIQGRFAESIQIGEQFLELGQPTNASLVISSGNAIVAQAFIRLNNLELAGKALDVRRSVRDSILNSEDTYATYDALLAWRRNDINTVENLLPLAVAETNALEGVLTVHEFAAVFNTFEVCVQLWASGKYQIGILPQLTANVKRTAKKFIKRNPVGTTRYKLLEGLYAWNRHQPKLAKHLWNDAQLLAQSIGAQYDLALANLYLEQYFFHDKSQLIHIREQFNQLGTQWEVQQVDEILDRL